MLKVKGEMVHFYTSFYTLSYLIIADERQPELKKLNNLNNLQPSLWQSDDASVSLRNVRLFYCISVITQHNTKLML